MTVGTGYFLIFVTVFFNMAAQIFFKKTMLCVGPLQMCATGIWDTAMRVIWMPWFWIGLSFNVGSLLLWLLVLSRIDVSVAWPLSSLGFVLMAFWAYFHFGEPLTLFKIAGILSIMVGIYLISRA